VFLRSSSNNTQLNTVMLHLFGRVVHSRRLSRVGVTDGSFLNRGVVVCSSGIIDQVWVWTLIGFVIRFVKNVRVFGPILFP